MSRELRAVVDGVTIDGWVMICNGCWSTHSDARPAQTALPLEEFAAAGWWMGRGGLDLCPTCVARAGGMHVVAAEARDPAAGVMGRYIPHPEGPGTSCCLDCDRAARAQHWPRGRSLPVIDDQAAHDGWHERVASAPAQPAASGGGRCA